MKSQSHEAMFELNHHSVMTRTIEGVIDFWNRSAEELYGWRKEEAVGKVSHNLLQTQFPRPLEEIESELIRNGRWEGQLVHTTREGIRVVVESCWTLEINEQGRALVEINARADKLNAHDSSDPMQLKKEEPASVDGFLKPNGLLSKIAHIVLAGGASLLILVSFYFVYHYGWTGQRHFNSSVDMVLYLVLPAVLASLLFGFLRRSPEFKVNAALLFISLIASAYAAELFLRVAGSRFLTPGKPVMSRVVTLKETERQEEAARLKREFGVEIDSRGGFEVIADLQKRGIDAVPIVTPSNHLFVGQPDGSIKSALNIHGAEVMPFGGISNKVTVLCNENGPYVTYESDEHGFQNPKGMWESKIITVAALGDSFAHGYCVSPDKNLVGLIRQVHPGTLNLGMAGNGPLLMLASLKEYLPRYRPKIVLWFYFEGNDLENLQTEKKSPLLMSYLRDDFKQGLVERQKDVDQALIKYVETERARQEANRAKREEGGSTMGHNLLGFAKLVSLRQKLNIVRGLKAQEQERLSDFEGPNMELFREVLSQAQAQVNAWGGQLYFVYLPDWSRYTSYSSWGENKRDRVLKLVEGLGIPVIDSIDRAFQASGDPADLFPFRGTGHYNESGHRLVAQEVLKSISQSPGEPG